MLIHFPLVLPFVAVAADLLALALAPAYRQTARRAATLIYGAAAVAALVAFLSGRAAADGVMLAPLAEPLLGEHAAWAQRTVWFLGIYAALRLLLEWRPRPQIDLPLAGVGLLVLFLLVQTGDRGAQLVYQYGTGVAAVAPAGARTHNHDDHGASAGATQDSHQEEDGHDDPAESGGHSQGTDDHGGGHVEHGGGHAEHE